MGAEDIFASARAEPIKPLWSHKILCLGLFLGMAMAILCLVSPNRIGPEMAFLYLFFYTVSLVLHELGHAVTTRLLGGQVRYISIGRRYKGHALRWFRFLGFNWCASGYPASGYIHPLFFDIKFYRLKQCMVIVAGPLTNVVLLTAGIVLLNESEEAWQQKLGLSLSLANGVILWYSLFPFFKGNNDIKLFFKMPGYSRDQIEHFVIWSLMTRESDRSDPGILTLPLEKLLSELEAHPDTLAYLWSATDQLSKAGDRRYARYGLELARHPRLPESMRFSFVDMYLTALLNMGPPYEPDVTDELSRQLMEHKDNLSTRGTRGSVLIDLGRIEEGMAMLRDVLEKTSSDIDRVYSNAFLALGEKRRGNLAAAREYARAAAAVNTEKEVLKRVSDLLEQPAG